MVLKGSRLLGRTILKCSWDASVLERLGTEYSSELVSKITYEKGSLELWGPRALFVRVRDETTKSATPTNKKRIAFFWAITVYSLKIHISFSFSCLPAYPIPPSRPPEQQQIKLEWPYHALSLLCGLMFLPAQYNYVITSLIHSSSNSLLAIYYFYSPLVRNILFRQIRNSMLAQDLPSSASYLF